MKNLFLLVITIVLCTACARREFLPPAGTARTVEVGLLLRKQFTTDIREKRHYRHVHAVLADGTVVSFNPARDGIPTISRLLFRHPGRVQTPSDMREIRKHYVSAAVARDCEYKGKPHHKIVTDWVKFRVTPEQALKLSAAWERLGENPPSFRLFGLNCATRAYDCLREAGILPGNIPGIDRPENIMKPLRRYYPDLTVETGYFGLDAAGKPYLEPLDLANAQ